MRVDLMASQVPTELLDRLRGSSSSLHDGTVWVALHTGPVRSVEMRSTEQCPTTSTTWQQVDVTIPMHHETSHAPRLADHPELAPVRHRTALFSLPYPSEQASTGASAIDRSGTGKGDPLAGIYGLTQRVDRALADIDQVLEGK